MQVVVPGGSMQKQQENSKDRWMYALATFAFFVMLAAGVLWLISINFFYFKATFPVGEIGMFMICALIILINIVIRIPTLLRWVKSKIGSGD